MKAIFQFCIFALSLSMTSSVLAGSAAVETSRAGNMYISGGQIKITSPVAADLLAAGGSVGVDREVGADAAIAGGSVDVRAPVRQDLRVAGGAVSIGGDVGGELVAAGGSVRVEQASAIARSAWLAGSDVALSGNVGRDVKIYANRITLSGEVGGDASLYGQEITLLPGARIHGNLSYASPNPLKQDKGAQVLGTITREPIPEGWDGKDAGRRALYWFHPFFILSMLVLGVLLFLVFPNAVRGVQRTIRQYPARSLLIGLALLFTIPPLAILFMVTVVGIPIGFFLLALYPFSLLLGYLAAAFFIGDRVAAATRRPEPLDWKWQALFLALALIALSVATAIPFLGGLVLIAAVVIGLGGWAVWIYNRYRSARASQS